MPPHPAGRELCLCFPLPPQTSHPAAPKTHLSQEVQSLLLFCRYHYFSDFIDSAELRAHPHHSFKMEGDLLEHLHRQGLLKTCNKPKGCRGGAHCRGRCLP